MGDMNVAYGLTSASFKILLLSHLNQTSTLKQMMATLESTQGTSDAVLPIYTKLNICSSMSRMTRINQQFLQVLGDSLAGVLA